MPAPSLIWFRRDLRVHDQPTFLAAAGGGGPALGVFVLDDRLTKPSGAPRIAFMYQCLRALNDQLGGKLLVVRGDPVDAIPRLAKAVGASTVHIAADYAPYGRDRDTAVEKALTAMDAELVRSGSPYAVAPGRVRKNDGTPYRVYTPFSRAWREHGWHKPADTDAKTVDWLDPSEKDGGPHAVEIPDDPGLGDMRLPDAGEQAALDTWEAFRDERLPDYDAGRDRPDKPGTSFMSPYLRWGCVHPRTLLDDLDAGNRTYESELGWREFHADVLWHNPDSARRNLDKRFDKIELDTGKQARQHFEAWCAGRTGFPIVDAGMRQLLAEGWMHNRVRMIVGSFLVKDLHLPWWDGARHFMEHLIDGDLASNQHNWQWVAGTGTDAAPYFRVFNPITQGAKFDPRGAYIRRYVSELADVAAKQIHKPWDLPDGPPNDYPMPIVDHAHEREVALARFGKVKG